MKQFKLIPLAVLASIGLSSCSDLLEKDSEDSITLDQYLTSDDNLLSFTYQLYGPYTWNSYEAKFSWCANELTVGNVYHNYSDEGAFFFLTFNNTNSILLNGYEGLYGVVSRCNNIIDNLNAQCGSSVSDEAKQRAIGEAYMMRGYCYYLLTEYWGEVFIVTHNSNLISNDLSSSVPKASRACGYAQAERDFKMAAALLPATAWGNSGERPSQAAAWGMLGKLYLTMAAAATPDATVQASHPFTTDKDFAYYNALAKQCVQQALAFNPGFETGANYENLFWPKTYDSENLFSLYFEQGPYGAGSARQINFARSRFMNGDADYYGGEKGLTVTLFQSFDGNDVRKHACSYYTDKIMDSETPRTPSYSMYEDEDYYYYYNPNKTLVDAKGNSTSIYGSEPESPCLNACRKFVYGVHLDNKFSAPLHFPILRTADLYLMMAEILMGEETGAENVSQQSTAGLAWLNLVRERAGLSAYTQPVALYDTDPEMTTSFTDDRDAANPVTYSYTTYSDKYDLFEERRHEFALECQNWLDLKRIYYRNSYAGNEFLQHEDRGWTYGQRLGITDFAKGSTQYQRQYEINLADPTQPEEKPIDLSNVQWFFPLPSKVANAASNLPLYTDVATIEAGAYPY